jgi:hypothetical protein
MRRDHRVGSSSLSDSSAIIMAGRTRNTELFFLRVLAGRLAKRWAAVRFRPDFPDHWSGVLHSWTTAAIETVRNSGLARLELATYPLEEGRSFHLSYRPELNTGKKSNWMAWIGSTMVAMVASFLDRQPPSNCLSLFWGR